jgi:general secretion pathway protein I
MGVSAHGIAAGGDAAARRPGEKGFTLLEVIVAIALFAAGIVVISRLFTGSLLLSGGARDHTAAAIYARQRMEEALLAPVPAEGVEEGAFGEGYRWKLETSFVPPEEAKPYDEIRYRVTVTWDDAGQARSTELTSARWRWKKKGEGDLALGPGQDAAGFGSGSGSSFGPGSGGSGGTGGGGDADYLGAPTRRRLQR